MGDGDRPPYQIPSMGEIRGLSGRNGLFCVSTFTGAGGSCLGVEWAGFRVVWANEFVPEARTVHELNFPTCPVDARDVREISADEILTAAGMVQGEPDLLQGSPPCSSFSMAGKREKYWGREKTYSSTTQRADDLFFEFVRIVDGLRPRAFVAENVPGLRIGKARGFLKEIHSGLVACGYRVAVRELDAQWLGVPQVRKRLIFVGLRNDVAPGVDPPFPKPLPYRYTLRDAIPWAAAAGTHGGERPADLPAPTVLTHGRRQTFSELTLVEDEAWMERFAVGREAAKLAPGQRSDRYARLVRPRLDRPCLTVTQRGGDASASSVMHPTERRKFSIAELRRVCGFPDDFELVGTYQQQWERLGRAVPPPMARSVAACVAEVLLADKGP